MPIWTSRQHKRRHPPLQSDAFAPLRRRKPSAACAGARAPNPSAAYFRTADFHTADFHTADFHTAYFRTAGKYTRCSAAASRSVTLA
jgi:hypothetical protein